ncbi:MAG: hypothetical protein J6X70_06785 [Muribaculaceae bacterium]|nr:hypothetical protein [Muribaculaceae bacterium]
MKRNQVLIVIVALVCVIGAQARQLRIVDMQGQPIPYVCVTNERGVLVGTTDEEGLVEDAKGQKLLALSHVAYKAKNVSTDTLAADIIVMDDVDFVLGEVTVKPKELLYVQTYFRLIYFDDEGPLYYRGGVVDNTYEIAKKKVSSKKRTLAKGQNGLLRFLISSIVGGRIDEMGSIEERSMYDRIVSGAEKGKLTLGDEVMGRRTISDTISALGYVETDTAARLRTTYFNRWAFSDHVKATELRAKGKENKIKERTPGVESFCEVYNIDESGHSSVSDFVMRQMLVGKKHRGGEGEYVIMLQTYTTDRNYIDKKEFKQLRKENEVEMKIQELRNFEKAHNIPPLPENVQAAVDQLFEKELSK